MATQALFAGLILDEQNNHVETGFVGTEAHYIIDDYGFKRHIPSEQIDSYILDLFIEQLKGNKDVAVKQAMKMMGKEDLFSKVALDASIRDVNSDQIWKQGIPQQARDMMGMMGFRIIVNYRGEVVGMDQPSAPDDSWD